MGEISNYQICPAEKGEINYHDSNMLIRKARQPEIIPQFRKAIDRS
jgi:hypothetical protein